MYGCDRSMLVTLLNHVHKIRADKKTAFQIKSLKKILACREVHLKNILALKTFKLALTNLFPLKVIQNEGQNIAISLLALK